MAKTQKTQKTPLRHYFVEVRVEAEDSGGFASFGLSVSNRQLEKMGGRLGNAFSSKEGQTFLRAIGIPRLQDQIAKVQRDLQNLENMQKGVVKRPRRKHNFRVVEGGAGKPKAPKKRTDKP